MLDVDPPVCIFTEIFFILVVFILQVVIIALHTTCILNFSLDLSLLLISIHAGHLQHFLLIKILLQSLDILMCEH